jgi:hypothetical protein
MKFILVAIMLLFNFSSQAGECKGHIIFYTFEEGDSEADADYSYYYHKSLPWLNENGVSTSVHTAIPIKTNTCFSNNVIVPTELLELSLGYVFVRPTLEMRVYGGVMTGVDLINEVNNYFK